jgi:hypothetical protein
MSEPLMLTGQQIQILREGIVGAYRNPDDLWVLLAEQMEVQVSAIVSNGAYKTKVFELIQDFEANGRIGDFIGVVVNEKPNSPYLEAIKKEFAGILGKSGGRDERSYFWGAPILILSLIIAWFVTFQGNEMKAPKVILIVDDIYEGTFQGCKRTGPNVQCSVAVRSKQDIQAHRVLCQAQNLTRLFDTSGNVYTCAKIKIGNLESDQQINDVRFPQGTGLSSILCQG